MGRSMLAGLRTVLIVKGPPCDVTRRQEELGEGWGGVGRPEKEAGGVGSGLGRGGVGRPAEQEVGRSVGPKLAQ